MLEQRYLLITLKEVFNGEAEENDLKGEMMKRMTNNSSLKMKFMSFFYPLTKSHWK